jgi:hypothetical protein
MLEPRVCCRTTQSSQKVILRGIIGRGVQAHALGGTECGAARLYEAVKRIVGADRWDRIGRGGACRDWSTTRRIAHSAAQRSRTDKNERQVGTRERRRRRNGIRLAGCGLHQTSSSSGLKAAKLISLQAAPHADPRTTSPLSTTGHSLMVDSFTNVFCSFRIRWHVLVFRARKFRIA